MKKFLKVALIIAVVAVVAVIVIETGIYDTRFWFYDHNLYKPFYSGNYVCGVDLEPGSYDVEIMGGSYDLGSVKIKHIDPNEEEYFAWIQIADPGFHFTVKQGDTVAVNVSSRHRMKYKKVA